MKDYIAVGLIGFAIAAAITSTVQLEGFPSLFLRDLGRTVALYAVIGIFAYIPATVVAGHIHFKLHKVESKMEGLTVGIMVFLAHFIITLFVVIGVAIIFERDWGATFQSWGVSVVFGLIFYVIGGFISTIFESSRMPMPNALKFQHHSSAEAPPQTLGIAAQACPTCGEPLRYIQQYQRWYCDKEQKYV